MLTALPTLAALPKSDPAPLSSSRPSPMIVGDNSFASMIRRQGEQRLDLLRLADQQALAARVSAAAATAMPRPLVEHPASRPPMPGQAPAEASARPPAAPAPPQAIAPSSSAQPSPAPATRPQAAAAPVRAKGPGSTSRPEAPRSAPSDSPAANRPPRERKPGVAAGADAAAEDPASPVAGGPAPLADSGPTGLVGDGAAASNQDPGSTLLDGLGLPQDAAALPATQTAAGLGAPAAPGAEPTEGPGQAGAPSVGRQPRAAANPVTTDDDRRAASQPRPTAALTGDLAPALDEHASPSAAPDRAGRTKGQIGDSKGMGGDGLDRAEGALARQQAALSEPAADTLGEHRQRGPSGPSRPDTLAPAPREGVIAAALPGAWQPGPAPAAGENPGRATEAPSASRRAGATIDPLAAGPHRAARPGPAVQQAIDGQAAAAVQTAPGQPGGSAAQGLGTAWQSVLARATAQPGTASDAGRSGEAPLTLQIEAPVDSPLFAPALGSQLSLLARDGVRSALLQLHPAEMGPISVEIALDGNAARIDFQALRADTRGFIEASLPALAGALQDAGLTLAGGGVFEQAPGRQPQAQAEQSPGARPPGRADNGPAGALDTPPQARHAAPRGLVDLVA